MSNFHALKAEKKKQITYNVTAEFLDQVKKEAFEAGVQKGVEKGMDFFLGLGCAVLHNSFGFGKYRIQQFVERALMMFKRMETDGGYTMNKILEFGLKYGNIQWFEKEKKNVQSDNN